MKKETKIAEHENPLFLEEWLKSRVKYQIEERELIERSKQSVKNINFSWHNLEGKFVIKDFPKLTTLNLGHNELEEVEVINCPQLRNIIVSHNQKITYETKEFEYIDKYSGEPYLKKEQISSEVEPTLKKLTITDCPEVRELYCSDNGLTDLEISQLPHLTVLAYDNNKLTPEKKKELDDLGLDKENPTGKPIKVLNNDDFINNQEVEEIDISNEAGWEGKLEVKNCPNLTSLVVDNCGLEELVIEGCPNLKTLSFRQNRVKKIDLNGLGLEVLYCSGNELEELDLKGLKEYDEVIIDEEGKEVKTGLKKTLKHLVCDNNPIGELEVRHLKDLESLYCFKCSLQKLDCSGLKNLRELYCANNSLKIEEIEEESDDGIVEIFYRLSKISIESCDNLEELDCAENNIGELNISNLSKLKQVSVKKNHLTSINASNCVSLEYLDFSQNFFTFPWDDDEELYYTTAVEELILDNCPKLSKVFASESFDYDLTKLPNLSLLRVDDEETDFEAIKNIEKIQNILNNPNNYSWNDLENIDKKDLYGVPSDLRDKLISLMVEKYNEELKEKFKPDEEENKENVPPPQENKRKDPPSEEENDNPPPKRRKNEPDEPTPKNNEDKDQLINDLKEEITKLQEENESLKSGSNTPDNQQKAEEVKKEIEKTKEKIINSNLDENKKQELLKLLEKLLSNQNKTIDNSVEEPPTGSNHWILLFIVLFWSLTILGLGWFQKRGKEGIKKR